MQKSEDADALVEVKFDPLNCIKHRDLRQFAINRGLLFLFRSFRSRSRNIARRKNADIQITSAFTFAIGTREKCKKKCFFSKLRLQCDKMCNILWGR